MPKIKVVVLLFRQIRHGFTKTAKVSPNLTVSHVPFLTYRNNMSLHVSCVTLSLLHRSLDVQCGIFNAFIPYK